MKKKNAFMIFSNREHEVDYSIPSIGQNSIQGVKDYEFLGVLIDDKLFFRTLVNKVLWKVSKSAGLLYKIRNCLPLETRLSYYYSQRAVFFSGPKEWNNLPEDIRKTQTIGRFKKLLKTHLLSLYRQWITIFYTRSI